MPKKKDLNGVLPQSSWSWRFIGNKLQPCKRYYCTTKEHTLIRKRYLTDQSDSTLIEEDAMKWSNWALPGWGEDCAWDLEISYGMCPLSVPMTIRTPRVPGTWSSRSYIKGRLPQEAMEKTTQVNQSEVRQTQHQYWENHPIGYKEQKVFFLCQNEAFEGYREPAIRDAVGLKEST